MFNIVLVEPEIPPNTGNVIRLAANTGCRLHLVEPLGFSMDDKHMRRAGLDYHEYAQVRRHASWHALLESEQPDPERLFALTTRGTGACTTCASRRATGWCSARKPAAWRPSCGNPSPPASACRLPMRPGQRSLNLSNAVAVTVFEAWRQNGFGGGPAS
jgi:tRNA (cytidine/uridine-2'-O-)-methyltransferase